MSWQSFERDGHIVNARSLWGKERFFYTLAQNQRGLANFTVQATIKLAGDAGPQVSMFEDRLKFACTFTARLHPILLATVTPLWDNGQIICPILTQWDEAYEIIGARIKRLQTSQTSNSSDGFFETICTDEISNLMSPFLFWTPLEEDETASTYELALATPHCLLDGRGAMLVLQDILKTIASDLGDKQRSQRGLLAYTSLDLFSPPVGFVKAPPDASPEVLHRCLEKWRSDSSSKMIYGLTPKTRASCPNGVTRRVMHVFSREESADLFRKFKSFGVTNNTALQAALWLTTVIVSPPNDEQCQSHQCASMFTVDARDMLRPEWRNYIGVGICDASVSCHLDVATNPDRKAALINMMRKITEDMKFWRDSHALLDITETISEGAASRSAMLAQKGIGFYNAFLANFGVLDNTISRVHGTEGSSNYLEVIDVGASSRISEPQYFTRVWTFDGQYNIIINYNDHYYDPLQMKEFLETVVEVLRSMLSM